MAGETFDILLRFITELAGEDAAKTTAASMGDLQKQVDDSNKSLQTAKNTLKDFNKELADLKNQAKNVGKYGAGYEELSKKIGLANEGVRYQKQVVQEATEAHKKLVSQLNVQEQAQQNNEKQALKTASAMTRVASTLQGISNTLVVGGTAVTGGIFKLATDFVKNAGEATNLTRAWKAETDSVSKSYARIGQVAAAEVLPFLKEAANVMGNIAAFAEKNPDIVGGALKIGMVTLAVGVIGKAVASGIKLVADVTYIAATATQLAASSEMVVAAGGMQTAALGFAATVGVVLLPALVIFGAILSGVLVGLMAYQAIAKGSGGKLPDLEKLGVEAVTIIKAKSSELWKSIMGDVDQAGNSMEKFGENTQKLVEAFIKMNDDLKAEDKKYQSDRIKINEDSNKAILEANRSLGNKIKSINDKASSDRDRIISDFNSSSIKDETKFETERANIIRDGGIEIQRIEKDRLEKLRQLTQEHNDRVGDLTANRDALGLVLEQRKFDRDKAELDRQTNEEIAQRRQDLAIRLSDLAANFATERAIKQAQFEQDLKDNETKRLTDIKEAQKQAAEEIKKIREDRIAKLKELDTQHKEEQQRIRQAFLAQVRDLDASLLGEQNKKKQYYALMLADLDKFLSDYRARNSGGASTPTRTASSSGSLGATATGSSGGIPGFATGGYVNGGLVQTHGTEFITSAPTTRALERLIGGRLTQQNLVGAVSGGQNVYWNDQRRFTGEYSKAMKRENRRDTLNTLKEVFKK